MSTTSSTKKLGKGLASMLSQPVAVPAPVVATESQALSITSAPPSVDAAATTNEQNSSRIRFVSVRSITPNVQQPRKVFDDAALARLAESIRVAGVIQPVLVRARSGEGGDVPAFELVAGERRWRAAQLAGLDRVPAIVAEISDAQSAEWALIENIQREDLNAMERAWALRGMMDRFGASASHLAERVGLDRTTVTNFVRLTDLETQIQKLIEDQRLSGGHGKALLMAPSGDDRVALARIAAEQRWSVRRTELEAARRTKPKANSGPQDGGERTAAVIDDLERRLSAFLGTKVHIHTHRGGTRGRITVEYYDLDHFDSLMSKIGFQGS